MVLLMMMVVVLGWTECWTGIDSSLFLSFRDSLKLTITKKRPTLTDTTQPHTIGFGFNDNPMAILTWVGEKYNEAAGPENQLKPYWTNVILTTASLYYFTDCIMPSMLCYYENVRHENFASFAMQPENRITIPFGYTSFYWDTEPSSKRAVERTGNLVWYKGESCVVSLCLFLVVSVLAGGDDIDID